MRGFCCVDLASPEDVGVERCLHRIFCAATSKITAFCSPTSAGTMLKCRGQKLVIVFSERFRGVWWGMVGSCSASSHNFRGLKVDRPSSQGSPPSSIFTPHYYRRLVSAISDRDLFGKPVAEIAGRLQTACRPCRTAAWRGFRLTGSKGISFGPVLCKFSLVDSQAGDNASGELLDRMDYRQSTQHILIVSRGIFEGTVRGSNRCVGPKIGPL
jgi:hypothetical protein